MNIFNSTRRILYESARIESLHTHELVPYSFSNFKFLVDPFMWYEDELNIFLMDQQIITQFLFSTLQQTFSSEWQ